MGSNRYVIILASGVIIVLVVLIVFIINVDNTETIRSEEVKTIDTTQQRIVFAIHPYDSPVELSRNFAPLVDYLSNFVGIPFVLSISPDYEHHIKRVGNDEVDFAFMGPASYVIMSEQYGKKKLLCSLEKNGKTDFCGYIITRKDNPAKTLQDLQDKSFATSSKESTMGYIVPRYMFIQAGVPFPESQLCIVKSHNNVCLNVLSGEINAGAIREKTYQKYKDRNIKVIATTPGIRDHPFLATNNISPEIYEKVREALLSIETPEDIRRLLKPIKPILSGLRAVEDKDYDALRKIISVVQDDEERSDYKEEPK